MEDDSIKKEAKNIMDNFMSSMKDIEVEDNFILIRDACYREEGEGKVADEDFRQRFLSNAPKSNSESILAQKGAWVE